MSTCETQSQQLMTGLDLPIQPTSITFSDTLSDGLPEFEGMVPAGCSFWQEATRRSFATSAQDHELCSIGVHTQNLAGASESQPGELQTALGAMIGLDYVREAEIAAIPVAQKSSKHLFTARLPSVR